MRRPPAKIARAMNALVVILRSDPRVESVYKEWSDGHHDDFSPENLVANGRVLKPRLQDVGWYYRVEIKHPPDSIHQLAREYAHEHGTVGNEGTTEHRSVVQDGIKRTKAWLCKPKSATA